ncbi:MAG: hypothetical protein RL701_1815 [Pseudomonadota bacterium]
MYLERLPQAANRRDVDNRIRALRERSANTARANAAAADSAEPVAEVEPTPLPAAPDLPERGADSTWSSESAAAPQPPGAKSAREPRRGFYLRAAAGFGLRTDSISGTSNDFSLFGYGVTLDLAAGYAVLPGLVVGGGVFLDWSTSPTLTVATDFATLETTLDHANLTTVAALVDWYPKRETLGVHVEGGLGIGILNIAGRNAAGETFDDSASGFSFFLGGGYEWRLGGAYALGALLRLTAAALSGQRESHTLFSPSLLLSFTWF